MHTLFKITAAVALAILAAGVAAPVRAADTDPLIQLLKQVDANICKTPQKLSQFYTKDMVIIADDRRVLLDSRIKDYQAMLSDLVNLKCTSDRKVLVSHVGDKLALLMVDETINVTSDSGNADDRQHSVCTYGFSKQGNGWKIFHEHCSSLPDYSIAPGEDALYYFHNPVY